MPRIRQAVTGEATFVQVGGWLAGRQGQLMKNPQF